VKFIFAKRLLVEDAEANEEKIGFVNVFDVLAKARHVVDAVVILATTVAEVGCIAPLH
jgi:hypothetical protein